MSASLSVQGVAELTDKLLKLKGVGSKRVLDQTGKKAMQPVLDTAKALVPVSQEGGPHLRDALVLATSKPSGGNVVSTTVLRVKKLPAKVRKFLKRMRQRGYKLASNSPRRRWHLLEFGTAKMAARPFIRPAMAGNTQKVVDGVAAGLKKKVEQAARGQEVT